MAAEKKKASEKKVVKKKNDVAKVEKKSIKDPTPGKTLVIKVPQGGQVIRTFHITPSLPVHGKAANWLVIDPDAKKPTDIDNIHVSFSQKSSEIEQYFERAVLIVKMQQNPAESGTWRFSGEGVVTNSKTPDSNHDFAVEVIDQGMTLIAYVHEVGDVSEEVWFSYIASFTDGSGEVKVYESQDPGIGTGRP
jgi:hypothetical protein